MNGYIPKLHYIIAFLILALLWPPLQSFLFTGWLAVPVIILFVYLILNSSFFDRKYSKADELSPLQKDILAVTESKKNDQR